MISIPTNIIICVGVAGPVGMTNRKRLGQRNVKPIMAASLVP